MKITFRILSYWQVGTGQGEAGAADALCARDADRLPYVPGRQVKGLFREAVREAVAVGILKTNVEAALFGGRALPGAALLDAPESGKLRFTDARLPEADRYALRGQPDLIAELFRTQRSTAIDPNTSTAKPKSLRMDQVAIPLTLEAEITVLGEAHTGWEDQIRAVAHLIRAVGGGRTRGLGRVIVTGGKP